MNRFGQEWVDRLRPFLPVLAICLLAVWPFISRPSLPNNTDAELHLFRLVELSRLVRAGILYPRWAPDFYFGYGYPIFNYYAPLAYYVGLVIDLLPAIGPVTAVKGVFVLSILAGGAGTFSLVKLYWGEPAGYVATALFVYSPYVQYLDPHARGVLAESLSLGVIPCALAALAHLHHNPGRWRWLGAVFWVAAAFLAHNLMAMVFGGLVVGWLLWQGLPVFKQPSFAGELKRVAWPVAALILAIGVSGFFWLPVGLERSLINITSVVGESGSHFAYSNHFLTATQLLSPVPFHDWGAISPHFTFSLGIVQALAAAVGGLIWIYAAVGSRGLKNQAELVRQALFYVTAAGVLLFLMLPASAPIWGAVPLLPFLQFPWRLLGPAALMIAVVGGSAVGMVAKQLTPSTKIWVCGGVIGVILLQAAPVAQVLPWEPFGDPSPAALTRQELSGRWLGTTSTADFVPATVDVIPQPQGQLLGSLLENRQPDRINYTSIPADGSIAWEQINPLHMRYEVESAEPFLFRLFLFDFPGWTVTIDGRPVQTEIGRPEGFLVVPTPAGRHQIDVRFSSTPARRWGWVVTSAALLTSLGIGWFWPRIGSLSSISKPAGGFGPADRKLRAIIVTLGIAVLLIPGRWLRLESAGLIKEGAQISLNENFGQQINLIGADIHPQRAKAGESFEVTLYWKAARPQEINFQSFVHIIGPDGMLVTQSDKLNPGDFPTRQWPTDKYVLDHYELDIPANLAPGRYALTAGLWVAAEGWRLPILDDDGNQVSDTFEIALIEVEK